MTPFAADLQAKVHLTTCMQVKIFRLLIVRHLILSSLRYKCLSRSRQNDIIKIKNTAEISIT